MTDDPDDDANHHNNDQLEHKPDPIFASWSRMMALAKPDKKLTALGVAAGEAAVMIRQGKIAKQLAVDELQGLAETYGLNHDDVQTTIADAFRSREHAKPGNAQSLHEGTEQQRFSRDKTEIGLICAADVAMENIDWLWHLHLARRKLTLLAGDSEIGKSQIGIDWIARISKGSEWPDGTQAPLGNAIILSSEDGIRDTIVPRLVAADADLARVHCVASVKTDGVSRTFSLQADLQILGDKIRAVGGAHIVLIDPITSYMGTKIDSHRTADVRAVLEPLMTFAEQFNVAVVVISHPQKAPQVKALNAVTGSGAFVQAPRVGFLAIKDPENQDRSLLLAMKNNLGIKAKGVGYRIASAFVGPDQNILTSHIVWDSQPVEITADQALEQASEKRRGSSSAEATEFLRERLEDGVPRTVKDLEDEAEGVGISKRTLERARRKLGVRAKKDGYQGAWILKLPRWRIVGPASRESTCIQCNKAEGKVLKIAARIPGAKAETLHELCADAWFAEDK